MKLTKGKILKLYNKRENNFKSKHLSSQNFSCFSNSKILWVYSRFSENKSSADASENSV